MFVGLAQSVSALLLHHRIAAAEIRAFVDRHLDFWIFGSVCDKYGIPDTVQHILKFAENPDPVFCFHKTVPSSLEQEIFVRKLLFDGLNGISRTVAACGNFQVLDIGPMLQAGTVLKFL